MDRVKKWDEVSATVPREHSDAAARILIGQGSNGVVEGRGPAGAAGCTLTAYFPGDGRLEERLQAVRAFLQEIASLDTLRVRGLADQDWSSTWKSFFQPIRVSPRLVVRPSWRSYWPGGDERVIELDPGMAFGTGTHPSTRMCLEVLDRLLGGRAGPDRSVLDVGTGSGILAIGAALLGADPVVAIDNDRQAIACACKNIDRNGVSRAVTAGTQPLSGVGGRYAIVVANILPHVLIGMGTALRERVASGGSLVLSGILIEKAPQVRAAFEPVFGHCDEVHEQEWACVVLHEPCV